MLSAVTLHKILYLCLVFQDLDYDGTWNRLWQSDGPTIYHVAERGTKIDTLEFACTYRLLRATCEPSWTGGDAHTKGFHCVGTVQ